MSKPTRLYPSLKVDTAGAGVVSNAGAIVLVETMAKVGLDRALSAVLDQPLPPDNTYRTVETGGTPTDTGPP